MIKEVPMPQGEAATADVGIRRIIATVRRIPGSTIPRCKTDGISRRQGDVNRQILLGIYIYPDKYKVQARLATGASFLAGVPGRQPAH